MAGSISIEGLTGADPTEPVVITFESAFDNRTGDFSFAMDMGAALAASPDSAGMPPEFLEMFGEIQLLSIGDTAYVKFPFFSSFLGIETEWMAMAATEAESVTDGFGPSIGNPAEMLETLGVSGAEVTLVGPEQVRGVDTTHFSLTIDTATLLAEADPEELAELEELGPIPEVQLPVDLWVGSDGLLYRWTMDFDGSQVPADAGEEFDWMTVEFEIFDYGVPLDLTPPPADQVTDVSDLEGFMGI